MICPHCEKNTEINCHCDKPRTISSLEVDDDVRDLALDLSPLPISNERTWAVIDDHFAPFRARIKSQDTVIKHQDRLVQELMRRNEGARRYLNAVALKHAVLEDGMTAKILRGEERYGEEVESAGP